MRPGQQNRRMRGRNNNNTNRKAPNPLTRNYESSGPDVKIRGNAQHIAEKYTTLARDALSSGDHVMAENYLQHAEHYNRIILFAQAQNAPIMRNDQDDNDGDEMNTVSVAEGLNNDDAMDSDDTTAEQTSDIAAEANETAVEEQPQPRPARVRRSPLGRVRRQPRPQRAVNDGEDKASGGNSAALPQADNAVNSYNGAQDAAPTHSSTNGNGHQDAVNEPTADVATAADEEAPRRPRRAPRRSKPVEDVVPATEA